jgi:hypothetical protein
MAEYIAKGDNHFHDLVYYNNRTEKLLKLIEPKKIQKSYEKLRAELTHILLSRQTQCLRLNKIYKPVIQL